MIANYHTHTWRCNHAFGVEKQYIENAIAGGLPVWMNLVIALLDEVSEAYEREFGESDKRLKAINSKYDAMMKKYRKPNAKGKR